MKFIGLKEPRMDAPNIEIETLEGLVIDLYNENDLRTVVRRSDELAFEFESVDGSTTAIMKFVGVRDLVVVQPEDWHPGEGNQIEDYLIRRKGPWKHVVFKAGGLEYEFNAAELRVVVSTAPTSVQAETTSDG